MMTERGTPSSGDAAGRGASASPAESRDEAVSRLEADLDKLRTLLREHLLQREGVEEELRASAEQYRMLAESMDDMVSLHAEDGSVLYVSPSSTKLTGYAPHRYLEGNPCAFVHPDDRETRAKPALQAALCGESPTVELRALREDGTYRWVEARPLLVPADGRAPRRILCVTRDIEQRHRAEDALQRSEERYRSLFLRATHGIYRSTPDGTLTDVNPALVRMLGYESAKEMLGVNIATTVYRDGADHTNIIAGLSAGELRDGIDMRWRMKDGTPISIRLAVHAVRHEDGRLEGYDGIVEDVTERQRRDELLRRSERMASLGTTLAGVAHELNNPLAAIGGFAQLMLRESDPSEEDRAALQTIHHESNRAAKIVRDLLTFARREEAEQRERIDLNDVIGYLLATQRYAMETSGIARELQLAPALPRVFAERRQIEQVALNLLVNARQALEAAIDAPVETGEDPRPRQPRIAVRTWSEGRRVMLEISDNGPGIPAELRSRIWDPFFTTKAEGEGTGLGLAMVHGIVTSYDGTIEMESDVGSGTRFIVSLPADTRVPAPIDAEVLGDTAPRREKAVLPLDILIVDDEPGIRRALTRYFASRGHAVVSASDGHEAVKLARQSTFDVVICDLRLPGLDGHEVVRRIRSLPAGVRTRCIIMSGSPEAVESLRDDTVMVSAVIAKPYDIDELRVAVEG